MSKNSGKGDRMNKVLSLPRHKQRTDRRLKQGQATWKEYREAVGVSRNETTKAKAPLDLNSAKDVKDKKKGFLKYITNKRKTKNYMGPLLNGGGPW